MSRLLSCFFVMAAVSACIGVSQTRTAGGTPGLADVQTCRLGTRPADDGLIDDFEDENTQINVIAGRDGYWWTKHDEHGSTIGPDPFIPSEGGADGSGLALRGVGKTALGGPETWGAGFGLNLLTRQNGVYDASKYVGVSFKAKVGAASTRQIRFAIGDVNTHPNAGVCKVCWNHFSKDVTVTSQWKEFRILFSELQQQVGWGEPRPTALTPSKLVSIDWSITGGQVYDLWVDDIQFLACK
jgi:Carbohydrate binding domain (family 11)